VKRLALALFLSFSVTACSQPGTEVAPVEVNDVWTRDSVGGTANAAVFMTIASPSADRLVGASTSVADKTDLMTMKMDGGTMAMIYLEAIDLPANTPVSLTSGGLHVWLEGLKQPLKAGQSFPLTLEFEKAGKQEVAVSVIEPAAPPPMPGMDM
jgi:copper(I)-binding protein